MSPTNDKALSHLLFKMFKGYVPCADGGTLRLGFRHQPNEMERQLLDKANILLRFHSLDDLLWVTAETGDSTVMVCIGDATGSLPFLPPPKPVPIMITGD